MTPHAAPCRPIRRGNASDCRRPLQVLAMLLAVAGCRAEPQDFSGVWKADCEDYWGVLITPAPEAQYALTFCGLSGCLDPGSWTTNTRIAGDPMYQVDSPRRLRIRRHDGGYFAYVKCSDSAYWAHAHQVD